MGFVIYRLGNIDYPLWIKNIISLFLLQNIDVILNKHNDICKYYFTFFKKKYMQLSLNLRMKKIFQNKA